MIVKKLIFALLLVLPVLTAVEAGETWRFLTLADWHWAEKYIFEGEPSASVAEAIAEDVAAVKMLKQNYGGDLILLPGDSNSGHWDRPEFIRRKFPGLTAEESILKAGHLCYSGMLNSFKTGGYSKLIMAVGDHEVGDNPWTAGSSVSRCQPQFREAFEREFNINPDGGDFLYKESIGTAASRPLGTKYENTSYAYRHKNVLFITVDVFHQEDPNKRIGDEGSVIGTVTGKHLQWLEGVLSEARKDASIKHIFVQAHLPVIYPVRKVNSSGMLMDDGTESPFWQTLRKHKVDIYFAGEVHANTATRDSGSDLVQLVTRGNFFNNFQTVDISADRIEVVCYNQKIGTTPSAGDYAVSGRLVIDKSGTETMVSGEGELALLDPAGRHFHFTFEEERKLRNNPIMGLSGRAKKEKDKIIRGERCTSIFPNLGTFGPHYSALTANIGLVDGVRGKAGRFNKESRMGVFAMGPIQGGHALSYTLWLKTTSTKNQLLVNSASCWSPELRGFLNLNLNDGAPEVMISRTQRLVADGVRLNDGEWHHIAASMPHDGCRLSEVEIFVDGQRVETRLTGSDQPLHFNQSVRLGFGGLNYSSKAFDALPVEPFTGQMDEISIWTRPLSAAEVSALSE
jgi:hypothetical protein